MKLDVNALRYLTKDEFRVLTAVEMGMKNVSARHSCYQSQFLLHLLEESGSVVGCCELRGVLKP
jgi:hypothetical protein